MLHLSPEHRRASGAPAPWNLAAQGATVALAARNEEKLRAVSSEIAAAGGQAAVFIMDVANEESIKDAIKAVIGSWARSIFW